LRAEGDRVLAGVGEHVELVRAGAADGAGVGGDVAEPEPQAREDARVGLVHVPVLALEALVIGMERVAVLHDEFARSHDAEARAALVAELGLDLVEVHGQPPIALELGAREVGDDLLRGRLEDEIALVAIAQPQELRTVGLPAARLLPQLARLHHRHAELDRAGAVHLFAHDRLDLAHDPRAERQPGINARRHAPNNSGPQHEPMAQELRFRRALLLRGDEKLGSLHWRRTGIVIVDGLWKNRPRHSN
jgi:hypothetical protein